MAVVDFATSDFETCPEYQNWANFINKSTNRIVDFTIINTITTTMNPDPEGDSTVVLSLTFKRSLTFLGKVSLTVE